MIFVTDAAGQCVHTSQEWTTLTGQKMGDALGCGWLVRVHPDDRPAVAETLSAAIRIAAAFSVRYRLLRRDGSVRWVGAGGVPSFASEGGCFIGYLGSVTVLADGVTDAATAYGTVDRFVPPSPHPWTAPGCRLDLIADHLIRAHNLIEGESGNEALPDLRDALFKVGRALAARSRERIRPVD